MCPSPPLQTRRQYLATIAALGAIVTAGCSGDDSNGNGASKDNTTSTPSRSTANNGDSDVAEQPGDGWDEISPGGDIKYGDDPDWRMHGHDTGNTFVNPHADGPSEDPSVQWTFERDIFPNGTLRYHQPLIVDGTVYTYRFNRPERDHIPVEDGNLEFIAIDAETGDSETVFTVDELGEGETTVNDIVIHNGSVYFAAPRVVQAHDIETGERRWSVSFVEPSISLPTGIRIVDNMLVVADNVHTFNLSTGDPTPTPDLCAVDTETGESLWSRTSDAEPNNQPQLSVIADRFVQYPDAAPLRDLSSGEELAALPGRRSPSLHDGELYGTVRRDEKRRLVSHSWETGEKRWEYAPEGDTSSNEPVGVFGRPVAVGDTVVVKEVGKRGDLCSGIDRETGTRQWSVDTVSNSDFEEIHPYSQVRVADSETFYYVHSGGAATAIDPTDGTIEWQVVPDGWQLATGCALAGDLLVTVGAGGTLYGIS